MGRWIRSAEIEENAEGGAARHRLPSPPAAGLRAAGASSAAPARYFSSTMARVSLRSPAVSR